MSDTELKAKLKAADAGYEAALKEIG